MKYNPKIHHRKSIRLSEYDYSQAGFYFITICTQNRWHLFGEITDDEMVLNDAGKMIVNEWLKLKKRFKNIRLQEYTVMPNHFHGIIQIVAQNELVVQNTPVAQKTKGNHEGCPYVGDMVGAFKSITTVEYIRCIKNNRWQPFDKKLWQRNYWEHIIRNENEYHQIAQYILDNPKKWAMDKLNEGRDNQVMESPASYETWMI
jgi:REP element-mobilizing transposase RayT